MNCTSSEVTASSGCCGAFFLPAACDRDRLDETRTRARRPNSILKYMECGYNDTNGELIVKCSIFFLFGEN